MKSRLTPARVLIFSLLAGTVQFGLAMILFGGWRAFFSHPALIVLTIATFGMMLIAPFSKVNLSSGEREDRANRWVFIALSLIALASAIVPPYTDRIGLWTIDGETTRWVGVMLYLSGGALRLWPVFVLGSRFSGLVAIQSEHTLETHGIYALIRNPSYLGMIINMLGWGWRFAVGPALRSLCYCWCRLSHAYTPKSACCEHTLAPNTMLTLRGPGG